jgi:2-amino-4-hydroxy-6-hydroxymethyldihydropteridine diphosphokinase
MSYGWRIATDARDAGEPACFNLPVGESVTAYIALGTNLGDRRQQLDDALALMGAVVQIDAVSNIHETEPVGYADQPKFLNMVARIRTDLPARELMRALLEIETALGRERSFRNAPRVIDLDMLLYDDVVMADDLVHLPHPRMHERAFVLKPLLEIAPDAKDPRTGQRYEDLLEGL